MLQAGGRIGFTVWAKPEETVGFGITLQAIQTHGGNGLSHEYGLSELWFITRLMRSAPVSREMVLNFISNKVLGLPKSY